MTSSDVLDAALGGPARRGDRSDPRGARQAARGACRRRAEEQRATPAIGRSHGIHAEPITAGLVFAGFYAELGRARRTLAGGARRDRRRQDRRRGRHLRQPRSRDRDARARQARAAARGRADADRRARSPRRATSRRWRAWARPSSGWRCTVRHWQRTEVGEAMEAFGKGQKGSSAMPHKKNPILSENLCGLARLLRSYEHAGARERRALARARHLALVGRARDRRPTRPASPTSWSAAPPAWSTGWSSIASACAATWT